MIQAQQSEKESAVNELKDVIQDKDVVIGDLHTQMGKLMERLSDAEQKLFELQDSFTEDSKSYRSKGGDNMSQFNSSFIEKEDDDKMVFEENKEQNRRHSRFWFKFLVFFETNTIQLEL